MTTFRAVRHGPVGVGERREGYHMMYMMYTKFGDFWLHIPALKFEILKYYRPNLFDRGQLCVDVVIQLTPSSEFEPDRTSHGGLGLFIE